MISQNRSFILALAIVTLLSYFNCLQNEFIWDDEFLIEKNTYLRSFENFPKMWISNSTAGFGGVDNFYRPTQNVYYLFIYQTFGYNKVAFHIGNIFLHGINGVLLFFFLIHLFNNRGLAFLASVLWTAHPTHVEAVGYISGTADPLGVMFFLMSLMVFPMTGKIESWKKFAACLFFFLMALVSKEAMIVMPALYILVLALKNPENRLKVKTYLSTLPFWFLAFGYMAARKYLLNFNQTYDFYKTSNIYTENIHYRAYTFIATLPEYLKILFAPVNLHMERPFPVHVNFTHTPVLLGLSVFLLSLVTVLFFHFKKKNSMPLFSWLWFFAAFVPMMGILVPVNSFILEHWLYLPSIMLFVCVAQLIIWTSRFHRLLPTVFSIAATFSLICLTQVRNKDWRTPITFYNNILKYSDGSARVHNNLAMAYADKKDFKKAIRHYEISIQTSDTYPQTHYNLARIYIQIQQYPKALEHLNRSLEIRPSFIYAENLKTELLQFLENQK